MSHKHHYHRTHARLRGVRLSAHDAFPSGTYTPLQVANGYGISLGAYKVGTPIKFGVLSLGGSYVASDLQSACQAWGIPMPTVSAITASGAKQDPDGLDSNVENALDLQCIAGTWYQATKTAANIVIAFGPNAEGGMLAALNALIAAGCTVISISWAAPTRRGRRKNSPGSWQASRRPWPRASRFSQQPATTRSTTARAILSRITRRATPTCGPSGVLISN